MLLREEQVVLVGIWHDKVLIPKVLHGGVQVENELIFYVVTLKILPFNFPLGQWWRNNELTSQNLNLIE